MSKPNDMLDSKPYCEILLAVSHKPGINIYELIEKTGKARVTLVEQVNKLNASPIRILKKDFGEKKHAYTVNYESLSNLFYDEILKKEFEINEKWYSKNSLIKEGLPDFIKEALLSLKDPLPETTIRNLLLELVRSTRVNNMFFRLNSDNEPEIYFDETSKYKKVVRNYDNYLRLRMNIASLYYSHLLLESAESLFSEFIDRKLNKGNRPLKESVKRMNKLRKLSEEKRPHP